MRRGTSIICAVLVGFLVVGNLGYISAEDETSESAEINEVSEEAEAGINDSETNNYEENDLEDIELNESIEKDNTSLNMISNITNNSNAIRVADFASLKAALISGNEEIEVFLENSFLLTDYIDIATSTKKVTFTSDAAQTLTKSSTKDFIFRIRSEVEVDFNFTILDANSQRGMFYIYGNLETSDIVLKKFTLLNSASASALYHVNTKTGLTIDQAVFEGNKTNGAGGAINFSGPQLTVTNSKISNGYGNLGGAINLEHDTALSMSNTDLTSNEAKVNGGAIHAKNNVRLNILSGSFSNNKANNGGAIYTNSGPLGSNVVLGSESSKVNIYNNTSDGTGGGSVFNGAGGGIFTKSLTIYNAVIKENTSTNSGGGAYVNELTLYNGEISGNKGNKGGGFFIGSMVSNTPVSANIHGGVINDNISTLADINQLGGGGLALGDATDSSSAVFNMTAGQINNNESLSNGGGVSVTHFATFTFTGGEINYNHITTPSTNANTSSAGGGIYFRSSGKATNALISGSATIKGNYAEGNGGGIFFEGGNLTLDENVRIENNISKAKNGGGIFTKEIDMKGGLIEDNEAYQNGGGVYLHTTGNGSNFSNGTIKNNIAVSGGGIYSNNDLLLDGVLTIEDNEASEHGGGIYTTSITMKEGHILKNTALKNGGGIYSKSMLQLNEGSIVEENEASEDGGGIYTNSIHMKNGLVKNNTALQNGGGIYTSNSNLESIFTAGNINNNLASLGGGVYMKGQALFDGEVKVGENEATKSGGGLYTANNLTTTANVLFDGNIARIDGGGMYLNFDSNKIANLNKGTFANNKAFGDGGAIYTTSSNSNDPLLGLKSLYVKEDVNFNSNKAQRFFNWFVDESATSPDSVSTIYMNNIHTTQSTEPFENIYNNYDTGFGVSPITVTFNYNSPEEEIDHKYVHVFKNDRVNEEAVKKINKHKFISWREDKYEVVAANFDVSSLDSFDFESPIIEDKVLYAQWQELPEDIGERPSTKPGSKTYPNSSASTSVSTGVDPTQFAMLITLLASTTGLLLMLRRKVKNSKN